METPYPNLPAGKIAYVRLIDREALPEDISAQLPGDAPVWGVHTPDGQCLAVARDRATAFSVARENDLTPMSAH